MRKQIYLLLILILHSLFVISSMAQPYHGDEVLHVVIAKKILETGAPIFDYGSNNQNFQGLWHIPLYIYLLSGIIFLFGDGIYITRSISVIFNILVVILVYLITKEILKENKNKENWALFAAFLYALNPLTIQSSILIDIDAGLLNFAMYLFLYLFIKKKNYYYLIPSLIFVFFSKEIGPVILFLLITLFYFITFNWKGIFNTVILFSISGLFSLAVWKVFASFLKLDFMNPIRHNFGGGANIEITFSHIIRSLWEFKNFFYFAVPFFILLFFVLTFVFYYKLSRNIEKIRQSEIQKALLFNFFALLIIALYLYIGGSSWGFPKYQITALPSMSIFIIYILSKSNIIQYFNEVWNERKEIFLMLSVFLVIYFLMFIKDPLVPEIDATPANVNISNAILLVLQSFSLYVIVPFVICLLFFSFMKLKGKFWICLIFLSLFMFLYIDFLHLAVDYSTYNKYGDVGVFEVVDYIKEKSIPITNIATHVHLGSYLGMSEYYEITFVYNDKDKFKREIIENKDIKYLIIWKRDIERIGENMDYFELEKQIGTYYVFKKS